jgi:hypothetical protein
MKATSLNSQSNVKQLGKFAGFSKNGRQILPAVFSILLVLIYLLTYLTGKADVERVKNWKLFYKTSIITLTSNCEPLDVMRHLKLYSN